MKDKRRNVFSRLASLSVKYRYPKTQTTIAGSSTHAAMMASSSLTQEVVEFEQATAEGTSPMEQTTFFGYVFQPHEAPRSIVVAELSELVSQSEKYLWIDLTHSRAEEIEVLAQVFSIHPRGVETILSAWKSPRLDVFGDYFLITATLPLLETHPYRVQAHQLHLLVGKQFFLSAHHVTLPFLERVLMRCLLHSEQAQMQSAFLLSVVLDELLAYYEDLNEQLQVQIEQMEERALLDTSDGFLTDLLHFKRYAFALYQFANQHRSLFVVFLRPDFHPISEQDVILYYRDLETRFSRLAETLQAAKEAVNGIFDIYVSHVSHYTNKVIKILTMVSTVLLPSTLILTFFSTQNITDIPVLTHRIGFTIMVVSILCVSATILWRFRHQGWW
jgi:magnesium transporter